MALDPYYWQYRCPSNGLLTRIASTPISDEKAEQIRNSGVPSPHFPCEFCGKEHEGVLERVEVRATVR
jgi:hypothetical protein